MAPLSQPNQTYNGLNYLAVYVYYSQHIYVFMSIYKVLHWCGVHVTVSNPSKATGVKSTPREHFTQTPPPKGETITTLPTLGTQGPHALQAADREPGRGPGMDLASQARVV